LQYSRVNELQKYLQRQAEIQKEVRGQGYEIVDGISNRLGLQAHLLRDQKTGQLITVFRGTDFKGKGFGETAKDLATVAGGVSRMLAKLLGSVGESQYQLSRNKLGKWAELAQREGQQLQVTGHSLGGSLAQQFLADFAEQISHAAIFNSAGVSPNILEKYRKKTAQLGRTPDFVSYVDPQDNISEFGGQDFLPGRKVLTVSGDEKILKDSGLSGKHSYLMLDPDMKNRYAELTPEELAAFLAGRPENLSLSDKIRYLSLGLLYDESKTDPNYYQRLSRPERERYLESLEKAIANQQGIVDNYKNDGIIERITNVFDRAADEEVLEILKQVKNAVNRAEQFTPGPEDFVSTPTPNQSAQGSTEPGIQAPRTWKGQQSKYGTVKFQGPISTGGGSASTGGSGASTSGGGTSTGGVAGGSTGGGGASTGGSGSTTGKGGGESADKTKSDAGNSPADESKTGKDPSTPAKEKEAFDPTKDENGKALPEGVERKDESIKVGELEGDLYDHLDEIRDAYRDIAGQDATLTITSAKDGHESKPTSLHNKGRAVDIRTRDLTEKQREELVKKLQEKLPEKFRIGHSKNDGTKMPEADFADADNHIHIDLGPEEEEK
jgi:hypothetical protein